MTQTVVGLFQDETDAQKAVDRLNDIGISRDYVDVSRGTQDSINRDSDKDGENGVTRFFKSLFGNDSDDADRYSKVSRNGYSIVTVHTQSREQAEEAADILDEFGAVDVDEKAASHNVTSGTENYDRRSDYENRSTDRSTDLDRDEEKEVNIDRVEEEVEVGKRTERTGGVRVRSRIVEKPVEETVRLRDERVRVERNPVNREISDAEIGSFQDQDIEMIERTEVPVVNKQARVVEEITVKKDVTERDETIHDTVRNTEVDIEDLKKDDVRDDVRDEVKRDRNVEGNQYDSL
ncbi:MAG: hypothetical protein JWP81_2710 [Ferruginibacter sp.]|nr:hypothetical protein [Ferruginibacter sp.]